MSGGLDGAIVQAAAINNKLDLLIPHVGRIPYATHAAGPTMALQVQMHLLWTQGLDMSIETADSVKHEHKCCNLKCGQSTFCHITATLSTCFTKSYTAIMDELSAGRFGGMQSPCSAQGAE